MTPKELSDNLTRMYLEAPEGDSVVMIHLFGIIFAAEIEECGESPSKIVRRSGVPNSYDAEVSKGIKLSRYVVLRED